MPLRFVCPGCGARLSMPDKMSGQTAKCPGCQTMFLCPTVAPAPPPSPAQPRSRPQPPPAPPVAVGNPFDWSAPQTAPQTAPDDMAYASSPTYSAFRPWEKVQLGFLFLHLSNLVLFVAFALFVWRMTKVETKPDTAKMWLTIIGISAVVGLLLKFTGQFLCCAVPGKSRAKGTIVTATMLLSLSMVGGLVVVIMVMQMSETANAPGGPGGPPDPGAILYLPILTLGSLGVYVASSVLLIFFLFLLSQSLQSRGLAISIMGWVVYISMGPFLLFTMQYLLLLMAFKRTISPTEAPTLYAWGLLALYAVMAMWFSLILFRTSAAIERAKRLGRL